ncbi:unnamed protein product [Leuciscus chuanchicus]
MPTLISSRSRACARARSPPPPLPPPAPPRPSDARRANHPRRWKRTRASWSRVKGGVRQERVRTGRTGAHTRAQISRSPCARTRHIEEVRARSGGTRGGNSGDTGSVSSYRSSSPRGHERTYTSRVLGNSRVVTCLRYPAPVAVTRNDPRSVIRNDPL